MIVRPRRQLLGVVLAGGRSTRYGSDKAFAELGGTSLVRRAARTLRPEAGRVVVVANDVEKHRSEDLPVRPDRVAGIGPLGGLHTAVAWAEEEGLEGAIVLATDMPFVPRSLIGELAGRLDADAAILPASRGPRGFEPLCAAYGVGCLPAIEAAVSRGDRAVVSFFPDVNLRIMDLTEVSSHGNPDTMFFNVNRPQDHLRADALLAGLRAAEAEPDGKTSAKEEE